MHFLGNMLLLGIFAWWAIQRIGKRRVIAPPPAPNVRAKSEQPLSAAERQAFLPRQSATPAAAPISDSPSPTPAAYLLGSRRIDRTDPTTAMMDMMAGPGLCSPHDQ